MIAALAKSGGVRNGWLPWLASLALVLAVHIMVLLPLRRTVIAQGPAILEAIMMDLAPEPAAPPEPLSQPEPQAELSPPEPAPPAPPEPVATQEPVATLQPVETPEPASQPELALPPEPQAMAPEAAPPKPEAEMPVRPRLVDVPRPKPEPRIAQAKPKTPRQETEAQAAAPPPANASNVPPGPAASAPAGQAQADWEGALVAHLARFKRFPPAAQRRGEQGVVLMRIAISRAGTVLSMTVANGSGYADLDAEGQAWIQRAQPLPAFPQEITASQMLIMVPLRFTLR